MPSTRPQAAFEPYSPSLDVDTLVETTPNFEWVVRVHYTMIERLGLDEFEKLLSKHVIRGGKPMVVEGYSDVIDPSIFSVNWLRDNWGKKVVDARDLTSRKNIRLTIQHYLQNMPLLANQWNEMNYKEPHRQRMYLKDIDCHETWARKLKDILPPGIFYLDEETGSESQAFDGVRGGPSRSGDLMSSLPSEMRAENLMCYIGHEGTYTPAHREMCATIGHNLMVEASADGFEDTKSTKSGSALWFMTETKDRDVVSEYWLSRLGHDIEVEMHFAQINAWKQAPFRVYVVEQKPGDFIIVPPLAPHQVWNRGTRTMKVAWNRTTVETLDMAVNEALFKARMVCRDEQYKNKAIIFYSLQKYSKLLEDTEAHQSSGISRASSKTLHKLLKDFRKLHSMYTSILVSESFSSSIPEPEVEALTFDSNITCSYCRCNIFNRFLTCPTCVEQLADGNEDTYDICLECYAMGRSCRCISGLRWVEQWHWNSLTDYHERWRSQIVRMQSREHTAKAKTLKEELRITESRRSLAEICQLELMKRPFHDISKHVDTPRKRSHDTKAVEVSSDHESDERRKRRKVNPSGDFLRQHARCHIDCYWEPKWKQAACRKCGKHYCYGILFRAYDEMPQDVLASPSWECPSCRAICGCKSCKRKPGSIQYTPKGTLLGHNTRAIADPRSVESLVDFSQANLTWIQKAGDDHEEDTLRLRRRLQQAEAARARATGLEDEILTADDDLGWDHDSNPGETNDWGPDSMAIDPSLLTLQSTPSNESGTFFDDEKVVANPEQTQRDTNSNNDTNHELPYSYEDEMLDDSPNHSYIDATTFTYPTTVSLAQLHLPKLAQEGVKPGSASDFTSVTERPSFSGATNLTQKRTHAGSNEHHPVISMQASAKQRTTNRPLVSSSSMHKFEASTDSLSNREGGKTKDSLTPKLPKKGRPTKKVIRNEHSPGVKTSRILPSSGVPKHCPRSTMIRKAVVADWNSDSSSDERTRPSTGKYRFVKGTVRP